MSRHNLLLTTACLATAAFLAEGADTQSQDGTESAEKKSAASPLAAVNPIPMDLLKDAIEPFSEGQERAKFLKGAGVDSEMTLERFVANQKSDSGFVRPFDSWPLIARFDANRNKTIDWLEAREYRRAILTVLLAKYDGNKNGRLDGAERAEANKALAQNKLAEHFNDPCCGGQKAVGRDGGNAGEKLAQELGIPRLPGVDGMRSNHKRLKEQALRNPKLIDGISEEKILPIVTAPSDAEIDAVLRPHYEKLLAGKMSNEHWASMRELVRATLAWTTDADPRAVFVTLNTLNRYVNGAPPLADDFNPDHDPRAMAQVYGRMMGIGPAFRAGFGSEPIRMLQDLSFPPNAPPKMVDFVREELTQGAMIIEVTLLARGPSSPLAYLGSKKIEESPDQYEKRVAHWLYNPKRPYPFINIGEHVLPISDEQKLKEEARGSAN